MASRSSTAPRGNPSRAGLVDPPRVMEADRVGGVKDRDGVRLVASDPSGPVTFTARWWVRVVEGWPGTSRGVEVLAPF